jgi:hypothetical protein
VFVSEPLVIMYARCGDMGLLFDADVSWNSLVSGYV